MRLSLDALEILDAIRRRGSFTAAGKELHKVPSTISYTVAKLEEDLGVQLFERHGPRAWLTPAGEELLKEGRHLLRAARDLEMRVKRVASGWETEFGIGVDSILAPIALHDDIRDFYAASDSTRLRITQETLSGTWEALLDRRVDLLVGAAGDGPSGGGYIVEELGTVQFLFVVAPTHPLAAIDRVLTKDDLQAHRAISVSDSARRLVPKTIGLLFGQDTLAVPNMRAKIAYQRAGLGFGFLPEPYLRASLAQGLLVEKHVEEPRGPDAFSLAWRTGEEGQAMRWWRERLRAPGTFERLIAASMP
jgi:DNA-binding transcriptional LysR family regulator